MAGSSMFVFKHFDAAGPISPSTHISRILMAEDRYSTSERGTGWLEERKLELRQKLRDRWFVSALKRQTEECASRRSADPALISGRRFAAKVRADFRKEKIPNCLKQAYPSKVCLKKQDSSPTVTEEPTMFLNPMCNFSFSFNETKMVLYRREPCKSYKPTGRYMYNGKEMFFEELIATIKQKREIALAYTESIKARKEYAKAKEAVFKRQAYLRHCLWSMREVELLPLDDYQIPVFKAVKPRKLRLSYQWTPIDKCHLDEAKKTEAKGKLPCNPFKISTASSLSSTSFPSTCETIDSYETDPMDIDNWHNYKKHFDKVDNKKYNTPHNGGRDGSTTSSFWSQGSNNNDSDAQSTTSTTSSGTTTITMQSLPQLAKIPSLTIDELNICRQILVEKKSSGKKLSNFQTNLLNKVNNELTVRARNSGGKYNGKNQGKWKGKPKR